MYPSRFPTNKNDAAQKNIHRTAGIIIDYYFVLHHRGKHDIVLHELDIIHHSDIPENFQWW